MYGLNNGNLFSERVKTYFSLTSGGPIRNYYQLQDGKSCDLYTDS
jgi:hypothetical protein